MPAVELCLNNFWDVGEALVVQHAVNVLPIVFDPLFRPKLASEFVFTLQLI